jgi:predicted transport protein
MVTVEEGIRSQLRNIESAYGRSIDSWIGLIRASGRTRHGEIVAWLKAEHGLPHGAANRLALVAIDAMNPKAAASDPEASLYVGAKRELLPIHARLMTVVRALGTDIETIPKKGYLSLRRRKQFAMIKPAAKHVDLGLILPGTAVTERLESAVTFNALFTHRVRIRTVEDIDDELVAWLRQAYRHAV